ncbi:hypothetical protein ABZ883_38315 [Streptomyces sp. NPDC046977]|uniref:hypothetical protein n=1 Tax=Streptomyces sp. NPDC046977 TaxID=3154703 RepID=UPI0033EDE7B7
MSSVKRTRRDGAHFAAPWDEPERDRSPRLFGLPPWAWSRRDSGGSWPLSLATLAVVAAGCAWLGAAVGHTVGALVGAVAGTVCAGLLHLLVDSAVSGKPRRRRLRPPS